MVELYAGIQHVYDRGPVQQSADPPPRVLVVGDVPLLILGQV